MRYAKPCRPTQSIKVKCPKCNADPSEIRIMETFTAYHPIEVDAVGAVSVHNALGTDCPSFHFDDGSSDYQGYCKRCSHSGSLSTFGIEDFDWT